MKKRLLKLFRNKYYWLLNAMAILNGLLIGSFRHPFYLHFIDGLSYASIILLALAFIRWGWFRTDYFSLRNKKKKGEYNRYQRSLTEKKTGKANPFLSSGITMLLISIILSVFY